MSIRKLFDLSHTEPKPRSKNQIWIKDVGFDEAPWYHERMGLIELGRLVCKMRYECKLLGLIFSGQNCYEKVLK